MTDRELLEFAAKAAGIKLEYCPDSGFHWIENKYTGIWWDPLNIDRDALRLAIKLHIGISFDADCDSVIAGLDLGIDVAAVHQLDDVGTRRAIVRVAAEIGKKMA